MKDKKNILVTINLYGPLRRYSTDNEIKIGLWCGASLMDVRSAVAAEIIKQHGEFLEHELLAQSAFADDCTILFNDYILQEDIVLSILPPVCGG